MFGTREPRLPVLSDHMYSQAYAIRKEIDIERLRADLVALPSPRNRLYASEAMLQADDMIFERFTKNGWSAEKQPFAFKNILGIVDNSPRMVYQPKIYKSLEGANIIATKKGVEKPEGSRSRSHYDDV